MLDIFIKHAKLNELSRVEYITKLSYKIPYKNNTLITKLHEPKNIKDSFLKKEFYVIVAVQDNKIVGAVRYKFIEKNQLYFYKLAVLKTYRNKSVGSMLIKEVEKVAERKGRTKILLDCAREKNCIAIIKNLVTK